MTDRHGHVTGETLQAFLDGELSEREHTAVEAHVASCPRCASELEGWRVLFDDLSVLGAHRPHQGFADRVLTDVAVPEAEPLAARVRAWFGRAVFSEPGGHVAPGVLQDFIEGSLGKRTAALVEGHVLRCTDCHAEAGRWLALMARLDGVDQLMPTEGFADRVMARVHVPVPAPSFADRARTALGTVRGHLEGWQLHGLLDGALSSRQASRATAHLADCRSCSAELEELKALATGLDTLGAFQPTEGFADRVMAAVAVPAQAPVPVRPSVRETALAYARRLVPQTKEAWAALSGVAVTPAVTAGLVLYAIFSHPSVTVEGLLAFAWWQLTDAVTFAGSAVSTFAVETAQTTGLAPILGALASAPALVGLGAVAYSLACVLALRVLYAQLISNRPAEGRYARASAT